MWWNWKSNQVNAVNRVHQTENHKSDVTYDLQYGMWSAWLHIHSGLGCFSKCVAIVDYLYDFFFGFDFFAFFDVQLTIWQLDEFQFLSAIQQVVDFFIVNFEVIGSVGGISSFENKNCWKNKEIKYLLD